MRIFCLGLAAVLATAGSTALLAGRCRRWRRAHRSRRKSSSSCVRAYPETIAGADGNDLVLKDGTRLPISDGRSDKSFDELLNQPDIGDMFAFDYPAGAPAAAPARNFDPGRIRVEALFRALYGDCRNGALAKTPQGAVGAEAWWRQRDLHHRARRRQGAGSGVGRARPLPASFAKYLVPSAGTYNCRAIANTERMSMHAYAAAIDINTKQTTYWQWVKPGADGLYHWSNKIPPEIVATFEKHGFIWGGRWYHFDTMHFEYRPELLPRRD